MTIFEYASYKKYLKSYIEENRRPGLISELADGAACDRTYLSQVLSGKAQLTPDQAANLAPVLGLSESEQNYFLLLVLHERAANPSAQEIFRRRMDALARESLILAKKIKSQESPLEIDEEQRAWYYSSWLPGAVHVLTSVAGLRTPAALAGHLHMEVRTVEQILLRLREIGLVLREDGEYTHSGQNIHVPSDSPYYVINHSNWRMRGLEKAVSGQGVHYSTTFTVSAKDLPRLRADLLKFIEKQRAAVHASGSEEICTFCCDLFQPV